MGNLSPFAYILYQNIHLFHQRHHLQSSGWTAHQGVTGHISTKDQYPRDNRKRETHVSSITCLWDTIATDSTNKRNYTNIIERKMRSNKVEYSTSTGVYCTAYDVKVTFGMLEFSSIRTINHCLHVDNYKGESGIGYDISQT